MAEQDKPRPKLQYVNPWLPIEKVPIPRPDPRGLSDAHQGARDPDPRPWAERLPEGMTTGTGEREIPPSLLLQLFGIAPAPKHGDAIDHDPRELYRAKKSFDYWGADS